MADSSPLISCDHVRNSLICKDNGIKELSKNGDQDWGRDTLRNKERSVNINPQ